MTRIRGRVGDAGGRTFIVQQSFPRPRPTTNPYLVMLGRAVAAQPGVAVRTFSFRAALLKRADVFHVHWPEILVSGHSPAKKLARQGLTLLLLAKLAATRTPIVRTLHNLELPTGISRRERLLLSLIERRTALWIRLNDDTPEVEGRAFELIPHGHYRDWFAGIPRQDRVPGRAAFVGLIRRYKGVEGLLEAFRGVRSEASLVAAGRASTPELEAELAALASLDERIALVPRFLDDAELVDVVTSAQLVVLPYREMHNSGTALTALSLDRPVLVPDNEVTRRLAHEVGESWVHHFRGDLDARDIETALDGAAALGDADRPDLSLREWDVAGADHVRAYRRAVALQRGSSVEAPVK